MKGPDGCFTAWKDKDPVGNILEPLLVAQRLITTPLCLKDEAAMEEVEEEYEVELLPPQSTGSVALLVDGVLRDVPLGLQSDGTWRILRRYATRTRIVLVPMEP